MPVSSHFNVAIVQAPDSVQTQIAAQLGPLLVEGTDHPADSTLFLIWFEADSELGDLEPGFARLAVSSSAQFARLTDPMVGGLIHGWISPEALLPGLMRACVTAWQRFLRQRDLAVVAAPSPAPERKLLSQMVNSMADGLIMTERHRDEVLINPAARKLLEISPTSIVTRSYLKERLGFYPFDLI